MKFFNIFLNKLSLTPVLLSISFILSMFLDNINELLLGSLVKPVIIASISAILFMFLVSFFMRDKAKRDLMVSIFFLLFFSYGGIISIFKPIISSIDLDFIIFTYWFIVLILAFIIIKKTKRSLLSLNKFIFVVSIFAVLIPSIEIALYEYEKRLFSPMAKSPLVLPAPDHSSVTAELPDIYYIVPDSMTSGEILKNNFAYDNSNFIRSLENLGFYVPTHSKSNYTKTFLSITSTLNMEYLDYLSEHKNSSDITVVSPLLDENNVGKFLKSLGYKYYQIGSWWDLTNDNPLADENYTIEADSLGVIDLFGYSILQTTMLKPFLDNLMPASIKSNSFVGVRERVIFQFDKLSKIAELPGPKFIFAHIISPHGPYVFDATCGDLSATDRLNRMEKENYLNQLICTSAQIEDTVTKILENSKNPPIILIQSDEGIPYIRNKFTQVDSWEEASDDLLKQKFPVFSAYYLPGVATSTMYSSISNVNSFRVIFNQYFSTNLPILDDKNYIFPNTENFYEFIDVSERIR